MSDDIAIKVEKVSKTFKLPHERTTSIKGAVVNFYKRNKSYEKQQALNDISFEVKKGEFFGIVGRNGSGKSTLLKLLAGVYATDKGHIHIEGKLTPFIELGVGFSPELTGRENVFLNGALLGFSRKEMEKMYDEIVKFAELEQFMDQKLKNYSSGMQVRLAFSIAIRAESSILLIDEVLAVGDSAFQKKCFDIFRELKKQKRTIVLVTHDMGQVERFCDRALVINKGNQVALTTSGEAASIYARLNVDETEEGHDLDKKVSNRQGKGGVRASKIQLLSHSKPTTIFNVGDNFNLQVNLERTKEHAATPVALGLAFFNEDGISVIGPNSEGHAVRNDAEIVTFTLPHLPLTPGEYMITLAIYDKESLSYYDLLDKWVRFSVISDHATHGLVEVAGEWGSK